MRDLFIHRMLTLLREVKDNINKWKDTSMFMIDRLIIVKISNLNKFIYEYNPLPNLYENKKYEKKYAKQYNNRKRT